MGRLNPLDYAVPRASRPRPARAGELVCFFKLIPILFVAAVVGGFISIVVAMVIDHFMH